MYLEYDCLFFPTTFPFVCLQSSQTFQRLLRGLESTQTYKMYSVLRLETHKQNCPVILWNLNLFF